MSKRILLALGLSLWSTFAWAQNPQCPTRPTGDSTNACASTAFVQNATANPPLAHTHIFVGNSSGLATDFGTLATFSDNGTLTITPSTGSAQGLVVAQPGLIGTIAGTVSSCTAGNPTFAYNQICIANDGAIVTGATDPKFTFGTNIAMITGGASTGSKIALGIFLQKFSASTPSLARDHIALNINALIDAGDGGTGTTSNTAKGTMFAGGFDVTARSGATNLLGLVNMELGRALQAGSSAYYSAVLNLVDKGFKRADGLDAAIIISGGGGGSGGFGSAFLLSDLNGGMPVCTTCTIFTSSTSTLMTIGSVMDFGINVVITNYLLRGPGGNIDGAFNISANNIIAATFNGNSFTTGTGRLTIGAAKTLTMSNTLTFTGTDGSSVAFGTGGTVLYGNQTITLSGDVFGSGSTAITTTLATVNSNVGTFGNATQASQITVNGKGLVTAASGITITPAVGSITGLGTGVATALGINVGSAGAFVTFNGAGGTPSSITLTNGTGLPTTGLTGTLQAAQEPAHTGDVTNSAGSLALTLATAQPAVHTWALAQTFTVAPVFTDASGSRTALGLGTMATQNASAVAITGGTFAGITGAGFRDASAAFDVTLAFNSSSALTAGRTLTLNMGNVAHTLAFGTTAGTITFPNTAADTVAMLAVANTFTVQQTISVAGSTQLILKSTGANNSYVTIDTSQAILQSGFQLNDNGTAKWQFIKQTDNSFLIFDNANGLVAASITPGATTVGSVNFGYTTVATSTTVASVKVAGGLGVAGATWTNTLAVPGIASDTATIDNTMCITSTGLTLKGTGTLGICLGTSGAQFKTAFAPMVAGIDDLMRINFQNYRYLDGFGDSGARMQYGTTAQDVEKVIPDLVRHDANGNAINFDSGALLFIGLRSIQQLKADNDNVHERLARLENRR